MQSSMREKKRRTVRGRFRGEGLNVLSFGETCLLFRVFEIHCPHCETCAPPVWSVKTCGSYQRQMMTSGSLSHMSICSTIARDKNHSRLRLLTSFRLKRPNT